MWYEDGSILYQIEGKADGNLGAVDNPYRLIKYVVIRPSKYSWFTMADLSIHQISVTSNFRTPTEESVDFPAPVKSVTPETMDRPFETEDYKAPPPEDLFDRVLQWWTFPWPELHFKTENHDDEGGSMVYQEKMDILGTRTLEACTIKDNSGNEIQQNEDVDVYNAAWQFLCDKQLLTGGILIIETFFKAVCTSLLAQPQFLPVAVLLGLDYLFLYGYFIIIVASELMTSSWSPIDRYVILIITGIMLLLSAVLFLVGSFITSVYQGLTIAAAFDRLFIGLPLYVLFKLFALAWVFHVAQCVFQQSLEEQ